MAKKVTEKAQSFRKSNAGRECRIAKLSSAREAIGEIKHGQDVFILTFGQFSLIDALVHIVQQIGPSDVTLSTWTAADAHLQRSADLLAASDIRSFRMIIDRSFETRQPGYCEQMKKLFGPECIRAIKTHAKFLLVRSATHNVVVRTSMNLNENPRLENIEVSESKEFAEFFQAISDAVFVEVKEGEKRSRDLAFDDFPDTFPFREVEARQLRHNEINEVETSHTIKKL